MQASLKSKWMIVGAIIGIVALALVLRLWSINFGLPYALHIDERSDVIGALNYGAGKITGYPQQVGLDNTLFAQYIGYYLVGRVAGLFHSTQAFSDSFHTNPTPFYLMGRIMVALLGALSVVAVYLLGKRVQGKAAGLIAGLLLAVNLVHVRESHFATSNVPVALGFVLVVLVCTYTLDKGKRSLAYWAGLLGGVVMAWRWASLPLLLPLWFTAWQVGKSDPVGKKILRVVLTSLAFAAGFALFSPQLLIFPGRYIAWAQADYITGSVGGYGGFVIDDVPGWLFYLRVFLIAEGWLALAFSLLGIGVLAVRWFRTRDHAIVLIALLCGAYFLQMASSQRFFVRYSLPLLPFLAVLAGVAVDWLCARWLRSRPAMAAAAYAVLAVALIAQPLAGSIRLNTVWAQTDTRVVAKGWVEQNIPAGSKIATDWMVHGVPLATAETPQPYSTHTYTVTEVNGLGLSDQPIEYYRNNNYEYLITSSYITNLGLVDRKQDGVRKAYYAGLDSQLELIKEFKPYSGDKEPPFFFDELYGPLISLWEIDRPGPTIKIYRVIPQPKVQAGAAKQW